MLSFNLFQCRLLTSFICLLFGVSKTGSEPVDTSSRVQVLESGDLLISNVHESDAGQYSCIRSNEAGMVMAEAMLTVMGKNEFLVLLILLC